MLFFTRVQPLHFNGLNIEYIIAKFVVQADGECAFLPLRHPSRSHFRRSGHLFARYGLDNSDFADAWSPSQHSDHTRERHTEY